MAGRGSKRKLEARRRVFGTAARPRLCVSRSIRGVYAQLIDDEASTTIVGASTLSKEYRERHGKKGSDREAARNLGKLLAEKAVAKGIGPVVFDRRNYRYHGRIKALADAAREGGLKL